MNPLPNARHEAFCRFVAEGASAIDAYTRAGYKPRRQAASRLLSNVYIQDRVSELKELAAQETVLNIADHMNKLAELRDQALGAGQYSAAITAEHHRGKCAGLYIERSESFNTNYVVYADDEPETSDEWEAEYDKLTH